MMKRKRATSNLPADSYIILGPWKNQRHYVYLDALAALISGV